MSVFNTECVEVGSRRWTLTELSALQRLTFIERYVEQTPGETGFKVLRSNLELSAEFVALHRRRWYVPHWYLVWRYKRLPDSVLALLFNHCARLSNMPFKSLDRESDPEAPQESSDQEDD